ncbi:MAG: HD domain-containing protein [Christensenellaceae bacterium]|jgi:putative nucleotidyltransferase with HDIG domain|nr:HD domain-containing protein [Christensenellaceae bacterium]
MEISSSLQALSDIFPKPLYVVGGAVRNHFAGFSGGDVDLASQMTPEALKSLSQASDFKVVPVNLKIGTVLLIAKGEYYEHTTFRADSYAFQGSHNPTDVKFVTELNIDAKRRDFTINAIYYDIKTKSYIDPTGGIEDVRNRIVKTIKDPVSTFKEDALRLLRLVRLAAETGFDIDEETFSAAKSVSKLILAISKERIRDEINTMLIADLKYNVANAHYRAFKIADEMQLLSNIFPDLMKGKGMIQPAAYHRYDVFEHLLKTMQASPPELRLVGLLHDIGKPSAYLKTSSYSTHASEGAKICRKILNDLRYPKETISNICRIVEIHMFDFLENATEQELALFVRDNFRLIDDLLKLMKADEIGSGSIRTFDNRITRIMNAKNDFIDNNLPVTVSELKVTGFDLIPRDVESKFRSKILKELLRRSIIEKANTRKAQLEILDQILKE